MLKFVSIFDVMAATSLSRASIYRLIKAGKFPKQFQLTDNRVAWEHDQIVDWMISRRYRPRPVYKPLRTEVGLDSDVVAIEGFKAYDKGLALGLNPYRQPRLKAAWEQGWLQAENDAKHTSR